MKLDPLLAPAVIGVLVTSLIDDGWRIEFSNMDGGGLHIYGAPNGEPIPEPGEVIYWAKLQPTNDAPDVIVDYSTQIEWMVSLKPVFDFAAKWGDDN